MAYTAPTWSNGTNPPINAAAMQAISDNLQLLAVGNGGTGANSLTQGGVLIGQGNAPVAALTGAGAFFANTSGNPTFGVLPLSAGGTGATSAAAARASLGIGALALLSIATIEAGGTGATTAEAARTNLGLGTLATLSTAPISNGGTGATTAAQAVANLGYASNMVIVSDTAPAVVNGKFWLKPVS